MYVVVSVVGTEDIEVSGEAIHNTRLLAATVVIGVDENVIGELVMLLLVLLNDMIGGAVRDTLASLEHVAAHVPLDETLPVIVPVILAGSELDATL